MLGGMSRRPDLTPGQAAVLEHLERIHPHGHHAGDVARHLGLPVGVALLALQHLERRGYARRLTPAPDERPEQTNYQATTKRR
jgi:DNA-binding MarR family transcriptional regulator